MSFSTEGELQPDAAELMDSENVCEETQLLASDDYATFPGDTGRLALETRRVLVQLLLGPAVDGRRQTKLWPVLLRDETIVRERLHELFLELVIDHDQKVAFTRQVTADDVDIPVLLRRANLSYLESVLMLFLRQRLTQADTQGERAVVSLSELLEHLSVYEKDDNVDHARFVKQRITAVEKAKKLSLLQKIRGAEDRFEVSPTLKLLFPAEEILALTRTYLALAQRAATSDGVDEEGEGVEGLVEGDDDE